jgi:hypothetical protein
MNIHEALNIISGYLDACVLVKTTDEDLLREIKEVEQAESVIYNFVEEHTNPKVRKSKLTKKTAKIKSAEKSHKFALRRAASDIRHIEWAISRAINRGKERAEYIRPIWFDRWSNRESERIVEEYFSKKGFFITFSFHNRIDKFEHWIVSWH